jgi:NADPH:quinone reductase-like Zn-dependent oxidoreductase
LQGLRDRGQIAAGQDVLIYGASGGVGTWAVQIAKSFGASVTAVCSSRHLETARSLGADRVIDYMREPFNRDAKLYDLIFVANGNVSLREYERALKPGGICVFAGGGDYSLLGIFGGMLQAWWISKRTGKKLGSMVASINQKDLAFMKELLESGKVRPVIDRRYALSETADAMRYLGEGHAGGKVVITVPHAGERAASGPG